MDTQSISPLFDSLKVDLVPIVQQILQSKTKPYTSIFKGFPVGANVCKTLNSRSQGYGKIDGDPNSKEALIGQIEHVRN